MAVLSGSLRKTVEVRHHDEAVGAQPHDVGGLEAGQLAAHRLDGEAQVVRHVGAGQRQFEGCSARRVLVHAAGQQAAPRQHVEEACNLFLRRLAAEEEHPVARRVELVERVLEQALLQPGIFRHQPFEGRIGEGADLDVGRCFGRVRIVLGIGAAEEVRGEQQADDLLASVRQGLGQLDGARDHVGEEVDGLLVGDDGLSRRHLLAVRDLRKLLDLHFVHGAAHCLVTHEAVVAALQDIRNDVGRGPMHLVNLA